MRIIARRTLREFWQRHSAAEQPLRAWYAQVRSAVWRTPADVKNDYRNASLLANQRVIFNIKGNSYRLVTMLNYQHGIVFIRFIGTHADYDRIDAGKI
ncbi:MAG: type II toxin-antitoxin system HigB family toxin [Chloroflexi bacterium]|nr:type II toxin-antitoxin system HigB family toxin [Chloroflexota bacterium]